MIGVNLVPLSRRMARLRRRRTLQWGIVLAGVVTVGLAPVIAATIRASRLDDLVDRQENLAARLAEGRKQLARLVQQNKSVAAEIDRASAFRDKRAWSALLALVGRTLPDDVWLDSAATDPPSPAGTSGPSASAASKAAAPQPAGTPGAAAAPETVIIETPRKLLLKGQSLSYKSLQSYSAALQATGVFQRVTLGRTVKGQGALAEAYRFEISCEW